MNLRLPRADRSLPLGVDIASDGVSIVATAVGRHGIVVRATQSLDVPRSQADRPDRAIAETLRDAAAKAAPKEKRCILCAPAGAAVTRTFRVPPGMRRAEMQRAANLEADAVVDWPDVERIVALDPIPGEPNRMLLSIARAGAIERITSIARAAGLKPVAVDVAACAWRRALPDVDAILDCTNERAELIVFGSPVGPSHLFSPRLADERLAAQVRTAFVDARRDGIADVQRLAILATRFRYEILEALVRSDGHAVVPVMLGGVEGPRWTLAYGLASWPVAPHGTAAS